MIPREMLNNRFVMVSPELPLKHLLAAFLMLPDDERARWYGILNPARGRWGVVSLGDLIETVEQQGEEVLHHPLESIPDLNTGAEAVECKAMGIGQARREMHKQPNRRLVVLEEGRPIGLLCDVFHAGAFGGTQLELYGRAREERWRPPSRAVLYACPLCAAVTDFIELIDPETNQLRCPACGTIIPEDDR